MSYGVVPTGFSRKPLATILSEIEASLITEFGPEVIQTPQSPLGQINGLMSDLIAQLWEFAEDTYQSYDVDQAEGIRLEMLGKLRLLRRGGGETDAAFRGAITNQGRARIDIPDIVRALTGLDGVTYVQVFVNDTADTDTNLIPRNAVCAAILGGDDAEIAATLRQYIVPGVSTYGNTQISTQIEGYCRSLLILRPILVPVTLTVYVRLEKDSNGCPPPSPFAIRDGLVEEFRSGVRRLINGDDVSPFRVRSIIESAYPNVEFVRMVGQRSSALPGGTVDISFIELATVAPEDVIVEVI